MLFSIGLLIIVVAIALRAAPKVKEQDAHIHGAGQIGVLAAIALFGVDYFTSYYYATGEMMSALHPYGLQSTAISQSRSSPLPILCLACFICTRLDLSMKAVARTLPLCAISDPR